MSDIREYIPGVKNNPIIITDDTARILLLSKDIFIPELGFQD